MFVVIREDSYVGCVYKVVETISEAKDVVDKVIASVRNHAEQESKEFEVEQVLDNLVEYEVGKDEYNFGEVIIEEITNDEKFFA